ncbi:sigma-70 family RNA polymerase sigma factor [Limosilactobacillus sp.]|uniref:sigma-70 family RNA polymerase sigma factor n=1 Tax=Limosilactobacillus sp. TaxID=2773925 RepID=UPI00345E2E3D
MELEKFIRENQEELTLITGAKFGDNDCLEKLFNKYVPLIKNIWALYFIPGLEYEDWSQEAMLTLIRSIASYRAETRVHFCWFYKRALGNRLRDLYRIQSADKRIPVNQMSELSKVHEETLPDVNVRAAVHEQAECLSIYRQLQDDCSVFENQVFSRQTQGFKINEIADALQCSPKKVMGGLERAHRKLARLAE